MCLTLCSPARLPCPWGFSRQEYWSGLPCPPPGDHPSPGIEPRSPALQADSLPPGKSLREVKTSQNACSLLEASLVAQLIKESICNVGDLGLIPGLERSPREGKGYPLPYSGLENSMDCIVHGVIKSRTQLSDFHFHTIRGKIGIKI